MLIVTNGLTDKADEGFLNVAGNLIKRMKKKNPDLVIAAYERKSELADYYFKLNKLLLHPGFLSLVKKHDHLCYIPFPARVLPTVLRIYILSQFVKGDFSVVLVMKNHWNRIARFLFHKSKAKLIVLSKDTFDYYHNILPKENIFYLKSGVDTKKFLPVSQMEKNRLKEEFHLDPLKPVILHVGHMKNGRNIKELKKIGEQYQIVLVTSTLTKEEEDIDLKKELELCSNLSIFDHYLPQIEKIYQMADLYFFPTKKPGNCIDVPLSCLEAASCNLPVLTTAYGEMKELIGKSGFYLYEELNEEKLNQYIGYILRRDDGQSRNTVLSYDWDHGMNSLFSEV